MVTAWHGHDWENHCMALLQKRYATHNPHGLQIVPARDEGDLGIEAFSYDGHAYQCYAAQEPLSTKELYEKQREKLTGDLAKLSHYQGELSKMLGSVAIHRYVFMVPRHDSRQLIEHGQRKAAEVRSWKLPFIDESFVVVVETDDNYASEREALYIPNSVIPNTVPSDEERTHWEDTYQDLRSVASSKLAKITSSDSEHADALESLITVLLTGDNMITGLRSSFPEAYEEVLQTRNQQETLLALKHPPSRNHSFQALDDISQNFADLLHENFPFLSKQQSLMLAWSSVADWVMRCPLDFGGSHG